MTTFDLNALARFAAVVERGGFSPAARALGLPRQSIHRSVSQLEQAAGVALLDRGHGRVRATDAGNRLFMHASAILREARDAEASLRSARGRPRGRFRLTAPHLFAESFLATPIQELLAAWPELQIDADLGVARTDLVRDDLDLAIRVGDRPTDGGYATSLGELSQVCCAAPSYLARGPTLATPEDLEGHAVLHYGRRSQRVQWTFRRAGAKVTVDVAPRLRVDSGALVLAAARGGLGVTRLPSFVCERDLAAGSLVPVCPEWQIERAGVWALTSSRADRSATLRAFLTLLRAQLAPGRA
jgi:DNA-binding transcriptional LysR family regulator